MPELTQNLGLIKPLLDEAADIEVINENMDKIDEAVANKGMPETVCTSTQVMAKPNTKTIIVVSGNTHISIEPPIEAVSNDWELVLLMPVVIPLITFSLFEGTEIKWMNDSAPEYEPSGSYRIILSYDNGVYRGVFGEWVV